MAAHFGFVPQTLGHYRIIEQIGAGGMGVVYRARDERLDRDVALKILPRVTDDAARKQFRKEALALAKLNHPNIETVHDLGSQDGTDFLVMELVPGNSLTVRLAAGPLPEKDIIHLGMQLAEGLAAAHEQEIVHRDLKPGNLMITPDGRLKILDFGLAKLLRPAQDLDVTQSILSETRAISGTVPYMSPEQLRGEPADVRSDIYAAGTVLYEMAAGQRPFPHTHGPTLMGAILHEAPEPLRSINQRIAPILEGIILRALEKEPARRYQSARELLVALKGLGTGQAARVAGPQWPVVATASAALVVVLLAGLVLGLNVAGLRDRLWRGSRGTDKASVFSGPVKARRSVAVLGFKNLSGRQDEAWLSTALSEMLTTEVGTGEELRVIPEENIARVKNDLALPDTDAYTRESLTRIRQNLGSDMVVLGSYTALGEKSGGQMRLDLRLQNTVTGETMAVLSTTGTENNLFDLVSQAGAELRAKAGIGPVSAGQETLLQASLPHNPEAARLYAEGISKQRAYSNIEGRDLLERAAQLEPNFALVHTALASAWARLGYDEKAKGEAKKAFDLSANSGPKERLWIEGQYRETTKEWDKAIEIYQELYRSLPDNMEYGLRLASVQIASGKGLDALATVESLRRLPPPASEDSRIDQSEAYAHNSAGDYQHALAAATKAETKGRTQGARLVEATALREECWDYQQLGKMKDAMEACRRAERLYAEASDQDHVAQSLNSYGVALWTQGNLEGARKAFQGALSIFRQVGDQGSIAATTSNIASILSLQGDLDSSREMYEEAMAVDGETGNKSGVAADLQNIGQVLFRQGNLRGAERDFRQSLTISNETGNEYHQAVAMEQLSQSLYFQGDLIGAKEMLDHAEAIFRRTENKDPLGVTIEAQGQLLAAQGELSGAKTKYDEALRILGETDDKENIAEVELELADLFIELGHPEDADELCTKAAKEFQTSQNMDDGILAHAHRAEALLAEKRLNEAIEEVEGVKSLAAKTQNRGNRLRFAIAASRVNATAGRNGEAEESLRGSLVQATKDGFRVYAFEIRLTLGEVEMKSGKMIGGRVRLDALEKDATSRGFLLIARKAHEAAGGSSKNAHQ
jgi:eukaryotic-like serine/threonine-protein kinase